MKTWFSIFLLIVVSLGVMQPARAQEAEMCPHPGATVADLRACVADAAAMGHIDNPGVAKSLLATLDAAQVAVDRGRPRVAILLLKAFILEVKAQSGKHIHADHAAHMINHAQQVISALNG